MMPVFRFKGKNKVGNIVEGDRTGRTSFEVAAALEREQIQVISLVKKKFHLRMPFVGGRKKVSLRTLAVFNRQLSVMFNAGLPITQSLVVYC